MALLCVVCAGSGLSWSPFGMLGSGGTSWLPGAALRAGDGERNVRSVMEPELGVRRSSCLPLSRVVLLADDTDALLLTARFDCTWDTFVGVVGRALRAAAAAADDNELDGSRRMKAEAAAVAALGLAVSLVKGC